MILTGMSASTLLTQTEAAISGLLTALADVNCEEYQMPDGRKVRRAAFAQTLTALQSLRTTLQREVSRVTRSRVSLGRIRRE